MNAFVAGNVNEVRDLGMALLHATCVAKAIEGKSLNRSGSSIDVTYKDGEIIISYKPVKNAVE